MALPLPQVIPDVGPGGRIWDVYKNIVGGSNALAKGAVEAKYAPITAQADAASKLAYANLMGPQFLAKIMGNEDVLANLTPEQRNQALRSIYQAGSGQGQGNALMNLPQQEESSLSKLVNNVKNAFGFGQQTPQMKSYNSLMQQPVLSQQDKLSLSQMQPGESYTIQGQNADSGMSYDRKGNNIVAPESEINAIANRPSNLQNSFAENVGSYSGIKEEGKESGKIRAQNISDLSDVVFQGQTKAATLDNISKIVSSPEFEQIRQTPILGHHELSYYERYGTPTQQNMVGQLRVLSGNVIRDAAQDFKGAFRKGEQQLLENMKINPGDTVESARGKMEQLSYLNKMITERARLTAQYMQQNHISKLQAEQIADKQINGDAIRSEIHNSLNPKPTNDDIKFMSQKYNISVDEVKKRLKNKGIL